MPKRKETLEIEEKLYDMCYKKRIYGCEEVTIGFAHQGYGNEIVDFCTMDSKGILRCYEIKVTLQDLKSKAKKSWYGHYNYLVVTNELYDKIKNDVDHYIPDYVGIAVPCNQSWSDGIEIKHKAKKQILSSEMETMMKESMVRSMHYKIYKYKMETDPSQFKALQKQNKKVTKEYNTIYHQLNELYWIISKAENILKKCYDLDVNIEQCIHDFDKGKILLPKQIKLNLTARGKKINKHILEEQSYK